MGKLTLSNRSNLMQASPIRKLAPYANAAKKEGVKIYHLNIGQPDIETPELMLQAYRNVPKIIEYGASEGIESYRKKLAAYYNKMNINVSADEVFVTTGGSEAIVFTLLAALSPGDEVIIPEPFYTNYNGFAVMAGVKVVPVTTDINTGFDLPSMSIFKEKLTDRTKAIVICNPGNPTGTVFSRERLQELVDFARENNLYLISDEVYREFTYDGRKATSILEFDNFAENGIVIDSVSKRYSACGSRVGNIVTRNKELLSLILKFGQARLCPPTIDQFAAEAAYDSPASYLEGINVEYQSRRDISYQMLSEIEDVTVTKPQGAFYMIAGLPVADAEHFAIWMLKEFRYENETVMVAPAAGFYATEGLGKNQIRIAYILNGNDLRKAYKILNEGLKAYRKLF
ncbi:MAG: pyridoxal phosphate-dependent aminotransferase [Candidatus Delongbacteria bacterium]|nr:pyridoxal phosphate-dependent aminotransferase [Candidatus Delongbacteria bacterium]MBN2836058.1 pyridoxal phosphate-dependent aminotransferase [Candidatus Delongbacteria bacterium]